MARATEAYSQQRNEAFWEFAAERGLSEEQVNQFELGVCDEPLPGHEQFRNHISIPYLTPTGTVAMKFRALDPSAKAKYNAPAGQPHHLYNVASLWSKKKYVTVCEGEFDTIHADAAGLNAVGISGTSGFKDYFARCLDGFGTVYVVLDNDLESEEGRNPGQDAARKLCERLPNARNIVLPAGVDISDYVAVNGLDALSRLVLGDGELNEQ